MHTIRRMRWSAVRQLLFSVLLQILLWCLYIFVIFLSPEDRIIAKIILLFVFLYLGSVISYMIGKNKRFVIISLFLSLASFSFAGCFVYLLTQ